MTEESIIDLIRLSVKLADETAARKAARSALASAITKIGRSRNVDFNRDYEKFDLTSGTASYIIGTDILGGYPNAWNMNELWHTDTPGYPIHILGLSDFNDRARGSTTTGRPVIATVHSSNTTLQLFPVPDSNYTVIASIPKTIASIDDVPERYHDVVADLANMIIKSADDPQIAFKLAQSGLVDLSADSGTNWTGDKILLERGMGGEDAITKADSGNLSAE